MTTSSGEPGWEATFYDHDSEGKPRNKFKSYILNDTRVKLNDYQTDGLTRTWTLKLHGYLTLDETGPFELGLTVCGKAKLWVDGELTLDNWTKQRAGNFFYGFVFHTITGGCHLTDDSIFSGRVRWRRRPLYT